jgi:hypothetical protein
MVLPGEQPAFPFDGDLAGAVEFAEAVDWCQRDMPPIWERHYEGEPWRIPTDVSELSPNLDWNLEVETIAKRAITLGFKSQAESILAYRNHANGNRIGDWVKETDTAIMLQKEALSAFETLKNFAEKGWPKGCWPRLQFEVRREIKSEAAEWQDSPGRDALTYRAASMRGTQAAFNLLRDCRFPRLNTIKFVDAAARLQLAVSQCRKLELALFESPPKPFQLSPGLCVGPFVANSAIGLAGSIRHSVLEWVERAALVVGLDISQSVKMRTSPYSDSRYDNWKNAAVDVIQKNIPPTTDWPEWQIDRDRLIVVNRMYFELEHFLPDACKSTVGPLAVLKQSTGFLGGEELANALGIHETRRNAFFAQLGRKRKQLGDGNWQEIRDRRANGATYNYRVDNPGLLALAADYKIANVE